MADYTFDAYAGRVTKVLKDLGDDTYSETAYVVGIDYATAGAYTTPTHTAVTVGNSTTVAKAANANRKYLLLVNDSDEVVYVKLGAAAVLNQGIRINASGGSYEMSGALGNLYTGAVNAICTSGSKTLLVTEGV